MEIIKKHKTRHNFIILLFLFLLLATMILSLYTGKYAVSIKEISQILFYRIINKTGFWDPMTENVILGLRLPRILATVLVGSSLSISGAAYQGIFKTL